MQAIENYEKGIKLGADNSIVYLRIGERLQKLGKYEESLKNYDKSVYLSCRTLS